MCIKVFYTFVITGAVLALLLLTSDLVSTSFGFIPSNIDTSSSFGLEQDNVKTSIHGEIFRTVIHYDVLLNIQNSAQCLHYEWFGNRNHYNGTYYMLKEPTEIYLTRVS